MVIDIIIILLILLGIYSGYTKGIVNKILSLIGSFLGLIVSYIFSRRLAIFLADILPENNELINSINLKLSQFGINISGGYYKIISFFAIFFIIKLSFYILKNILGTVNKIPVLKTVNRFLGAILGFVEIYILLFIIVYLVYVLPLNDTINKYLADAILPNLIFEKTPILSKLLIDYFFTYIKI